MYLLAISEVISLVGPSAIHPQAAGTVETKISRRLVCTFVRYSVCVVYTETIIDQPSVPVKVVDIHLALQ